MRTVGQALKEAREAKFYTVDEVEKATKIRKELLLALESDDYAKLPPPTFVQGFIKNYAKFLGLDSSQLLAVFRRGFSDKKHQPRVLDAFINPVGKPRFKLTPARVLGGVVALVVITFFVYLWFQYRQFVGAPELTLTSPVDQLTTDIPTVVVEGKTEADNKITVNNQEVKVGLDGNFKEEINLSGAVNKLDISAVSRFGQKTQIERTVYLKR